MTAEKLKSLTLKDLAQLAKRHGVHGWHSMRKDQLVRALINGKRNGSVNGAKTAATSRSVAVARTTPVAAAAKTTARRKSVPAPKAKSPPPKSPHVVRRIQQAKLEQARSKNLAYRTPTGQGQGFQRDRLVAMVRDPYWLQCYWELRRQSVERAEAALGQEWHMAKPVLRLIEVASKNTTSTSETVVRHIDIHGGVNNWYIEVTEPPRTYRVEIGYLTPSGRFYMLTRSNVVSTPRPGASDSLDENWAGVAENFEKVYALSGGYSPEGPNAELQELFEERLRRPMGTPMITRYASGAEPLPALGRKNEFNFDLNAELIIFGTTSPDAHVMLQGEPVPLRPDGSFTVRFNLPNCRQVIPAVASSVDGLEQRTIVLAVERNTKVMEPVTRDTAD